ncbi:sensor histidine kinase [Alkalicoccobacillus murimartini]|uniref:histidine kinase n=1 Tax=Alkalicoccobacillus murimartini TaxID=171685 RepID=A0ABT9YN53_9BACI|nr:sensor histidine kinase [Alkalicoccobacillus murimartini]MDQ0208632.1 NarL family two-component system sensor histidine kinase YdfH [Alkalicoccobacillus murimartini]
MNVHMKNIAFNSSQSDSQNILNDSRVPALIWVVLVYFSVIYTQFSVISTWFELISFTAFILIHSLLHWYAGSIVAKGPWIYFLIQGLVVWGCAFVMPNAHSEIFVSLLTALAGQSIGVYLKRMKVFLVCAFYCTLFSFSIIWFDPNENVLANVPSLLFIMFFVIGYASLFYKQVRAKVRTQLFLHELEQSHRKVEELTIANERQRMARNLHDTLAQGVAGLIMQLDAVDAQLKNGNEKRAHEIVQRSKAQAKRTLSEARTAIDDLRSYSAEELDISKAVKIEAEHFRNTTGISISTQVMPHPPEVSKLIFEHSLHIIRECLANTAKHSNASKVEVFITCEKNVLELKVTDDGLGFDTKLIEQQSGSYGLIGLYERVRILGGDMKINSGKQGTDVSVRIPLQQEETDL